MENSSLNNAFLKNAWPCPVVDKVCKTCTQKMQKLQKQIAIFELLIARLLIDNLYDFEKPSG